MSEENVEVVRAVYERWLQGDYSTAEWADSDLEFFLETPGGGGTWRGREAMASSWRDFLHAWQDFRVGAVKEIIDVGDKVLVLHEFGGSGRESGLPIKGMRGAALFTFEGPKVVRLALFTDWDVALEAAGLSE
jgi:ketosteroid isomerase-like protein